MSDSALLAHDHARGVRLIAGVDEVGRACLAGPIMAAGVLFDLERLPSGAGRNLLRELDDSKRLARTKRERIAQAVIVHAEAVSLVSIPASQIDRIGIDPANVPARDPSAALAATATAVVARTAIASCPSRSFQSPGTISTERRTTQGLQRGVSIEWTYHPRIGQ